MMDTIIYHYTSLKAFYEIINTKSLILTSLRGMNDPLECSYTPGKFLSDCNSIDLNEIKNIEIKELIRILLKKINSEKETFLKKCKCPTETYCISFSKKMDNLAHWERYANNLQGVCISFNLKELEKYKTPLANDLLIQSIIYNDEIRKDVIKDSLVNFYKSMSDFLLKNKENNIIEILKENCCAHFFGMYSSILQYIKNDYWYDEDEIRILYDEESWKTFLKAVRTIKNTNGIDCEDAFNEIHNKLGLDKTEFNMFNTIRPCKRLSLEPFWSSMLIPEITLGSKCSQNIKDLKVFLKANGLAKTKIIESRIKIR